VNREPRPDLVSGVPAGPHLGADVAALADGQLRGSALDRALGHVAVCADCRGEVEAQRGLKAAVVALPDLVPSELLHSMLLSLSVPASAPVSPRSPRRTRTFVLTGVAVGVLGGGLTMALSGGGDPAGSPARPATDLVPAALRIPSAQPVVVRLPDVVRMSGEQGRTVPLVADLSGR
jgi:hypothetical protein